MCRAGDDESKTGSAVDETVDRSVVMYNYAVALYHMRQFESAHRLLDSLVGSVLTPVDEHLAMRASFLMLDMYATGYRGAVQSDQDVSAVYESAMRLVAWLEEPHSFNGGAGASRSSNSANQSANPPMQRTLSLASEPKALRDGLRGPRRSPYKRQLSYNHQRGFAKPSLPHPAPSLQKLRPLQPPLGLSSARDVPSRGLTSHVAR